mmetsp:Transcript_21128/g.36000  ORF Transcript_21128/g.36000 Transcript_21128/m.36000 type:complete len:161 (+) Transcript_21128:2274-2756(+)
MHEVPARIVQRAFAARQTAVGTGTEGVKPDAQVIVGASVPTGMGEGVETVPAASNVVATQLLAMQAVPAATVQDAPPERQTAMGDPEKPAIQIRTGALVPETVVTGYETPPATFKEVAAQLLATHEVPALIVQDAPLARQTAVGEPEKPGEQVRVGFVAP